MAILEARVCEFCSHTVSLWHELDEGQVVCWRCWAMWHKDLPSEHSEEWWG